MCRNISRLDFPLFRARGIETIERAGGDVICGVCHEKFTAFGIYRNAVRNSDLFIRTIGNEIFGGHSLSSCVDFCVTYRVAVRHVTPLCAVQIQKVIAKGHIAAW